MGDPKILDETSFSKERNTASFAVKINKLGRESAIKSEHADRPRRPTRQLRNVDHEAMRDLIRLRSVVRQVVTRARQHLQGFLLPRA
jgi:hypothetical protein